MGAKLLFRDSSGRDSSVDVPAEGVFLGRGADCAVRTDDAMVSRKNCKIAFAAGKWMVEDLGSSNGTFVNEVRIQKQALTHADVVRCGTLQVRFVETADAIPVGGQQAGATPATPQARPMSSGTSGASGPTARPKTAAMDAVNVGDPGSSVQIDPGYSGSGLNPQQLLSQKEQELAQAVGERDMLAARLREAFGEATAANQRADAATSELNRLRADATAKTRELGLKDEEIAGLTKVGHELRDELDQLRQDHLAARSKVDELAEDLESRSRQLERAEAEVVRAKKLADDERMKAAEAQKVKDAGWKQLNDATTEADQLREVIKQLERMIDENKAGMASLDAASKGLRADLEKQGRELVQVKAERDELRDKVIRQQHTVEALEEEQRRLARLLSQGGGGDVGAGAGSAEQVQLATELRELKVQLRQSESERTRAQERLEAVERERAELEQKAAQADVDRAAAQQQKGTIDQARLRLEERLAKSEAARAKAEDALAQAEQSRLAGKGDQDRLLLDVERERKRVAELTLELQRTKEAAANASAEQLQAATHPQLVDSTAEIAVPVDARVQQLEDEVARLQHSLQLATAATGGAGAAAANESAPSGNGHADLQVLKRKAEDAYNGINDVLSEVRTNILMAKDVVAEHGKVLPDGQLRTLEDSINVVVDRTDDAKQALRELRAVVES